MPRYFIDTIKGDDVATDLEGQELPNLEAAREEALASARQLMSERLEEGTSTVGRAICIRSVTGETLLTVPFSDAIKL